MSIKLHWKFILPILTIPLIIVAIWFKYGLIVGGGDEALIFYDPRRVLELSFQTWLDLGTGAPVLYWLSRTNFLYLITILHTGLQIPTFILQAATYYVLMITGGLAVYFFTYFLSNKNDYSRLVSLIAAIFYLLNPFSVSQVWARGLYAQYFSFALLPLSLLIFSIGLKKRNFIYTLFLALVSFFLSTAFGFFTSVATVWSILLVYLLYWFFLSKQKKQDIIFGSCFFVLSLFLFCIINTWWLLPLIVSGEKILAGYLTNPDENLGSLVGVSRNFTPDILIRLLQRTYFYDAGFDPKVYSQLIFQLISYISPFFLLFGLFKIFKRRETKRLSFFLLIFIIGLLVSLGANPPFGKLFVYIFKHIPFLQAFRNPYEKFGLVYSLGYSVLFAFGLVYFFENRFINGKLKYLGILSVLILICGIFAWPVWIGRVVAGPDRNIGIPVPSSYNNLQEFLSNNGEDYRVFMTPLWGGEGAFYNWSGIRYQGVDPMEFILSKPAISAGFQIPFYNDYILNIRRYMERVDLAPSLALLRAKYLVDRGDATALTDSEKLHTKFLTEAIYPPLEAIGAEKSICQNQSANSLQSGTAWVVCKLSSAEGDWSKIRYLHLTVKTFTPAYLEIAVRDKKEIRIRWDGRTVPEYRTDSNEWTEITLPLSAPSEYNADINFSDISMVEVFAHPKDNQQASVYEILVKDIKLDPGKEEKTNEFQLVKTFGQLKVYEPLHLVAPPEFGVLSSVSEVSDFPQLFEEAYKNRDVTNKKGFILVPQNPKKDLNKLDEINSLEVLEKDKISDTKYWLKVKEASNGGLLILSKNFNPEWKIIPGATKDQLRGNFFDDLNLLKQAVLSEDKHYIVNGYANLWKIDGKNNQYAIVFTPQIIVDLGYKITIVGVLISLSFCIIFFIRARLHND